MGKKSTTEEFIKKAIKIHGNKYDYSKVKYITSKNKVIIKCKIHKEFEQIPNSHLRGIGCAKCGSQRAGDNQKSTTEEFIKKAIKIHGDKYDYSKTEFKISKIKVKIICKKCDKSFNQFPNNHLSGMGCAECGSQRTGDKQRSTIEEFIKRAKKVHGDKYDYSKIKYKKATEKVVITCKKCNKSFRQKAHSHLEGHGCQACQILNITLTAEEFIKKAKKIHGDKYDYSKVDYKKTKEKVVIICKKCKKDFKQTPSSHLRKRGCPLCKKKREKEVGELLKKYLINFIITSQKLIYKYIGKDKKTHKRFCDFYLQKKDKIIIIEYDGAQHFRPTRFGGMSQKKANKSFERQQYIDKQDKNFCSSNDILLWRIKYNENKEESIIKLKNTI